MAPDAVGTTVRAFGSRAPERVGSGPDSAEVEPRLGEVQVGGGVLLGEGVHVGVLVAERLEGADAVGLPSCEAPPPGPRAVTVLMAAVPLLRVPIVTVETLPTRPWTVPGGSIVTAVNHHWS